MRKRICRELNFVVATVLVGLLFAVLPLHASESVHLEEASDERPAIHPDIMNGLVTSDYPAVGVILEGPSMDNNYQFCSGTLIGCNTFLTAAHCLCANNAFCDDHDVSTGWVYFPNGGIYGVSDVHVHPDFVFPFADVAIVTLSEPVTGITPARINDVGPVLPGTRGTIVGYGLSDLQYWSQGVKRSGKITTVPCSNGITDEASLCWDYVAPLGAPGEDSNTCFGDSGGPMFVDMAEPGAAEPNIVVAGVTSGGLNACEADDLSFDANVYTYRPFIQEVAGDDLGTGSCGEMRPVGSAETVVASGYGELGLFNNNEVQVFEVPPDIDLLRITMNAGGWDFQNFWMSVNHGSPADPAEDEGADCRYTGLSQYALCELENPVAGQWYVTVRSMQGVSEYQVTATMFGNRPSSGEVMVDITPSTQAVSPNGILPYTVEVRNNSDEFTQVSPQWRFQNPTGGEYLFGPFDTPLQPGETWTHEGNVGFFEQAAPGPWTMIVESTLPDGSYDRDWTALTVQTEHAVGVHLSSDTSLVRPGDLWPYTVALQNVLGRPLSGSATWTIADPDGSATTYGPYPISLAAGETWQRDLSVGYFPQGPQGVWTLTVETLASGFVDQDSIQVELLPFGLANFERFEGAWDLRDITPDGRIMVGNTDFLAGGFIWSEETGIVPLGNDPTVSAAAVSDDGSVVAGHTVFYTTGGNSFLAAVWTENAGWEDLPLLQDPAIVCGSSLSHGYDISGDGSTVVGLAWYDGCHACAFHWTAESGMRCLPDAPDSWATRANAVSFDGSFVGGWDGWEVQGYRRAAYWTAETPGDPFSPYTETLPGSPWYAPDPLNGPGEVLAVTNDGLAMTGETGWGSEPTIPGGFHWSATEGFTNIWAIQDTWTTWGDAMTADGSVVVGTMGPAGIPLRVAFIWTKDAGTMLLEQRLNSLGADIGDFTYLAYASGITADGKTIVGSTPGEGAWVATLPSDPDPGAPGRAGTGSLIVEDGVPLHLPAVPAPPKRPQPEFDVIERPASLLETGAIQFGSNWTDTARTSPVPWRRPGAFASFARFSQITGRSQGIPDRRVDRPPVYLETAE